MTDKELNKKIGQILRGWRNKAKLTQRQAAPLIGKTYAMIGHYERGANPCPPDMVLKMQQVYKVPKKYHLMENPY